MPGWLPWPKNWPTNPLQLIPAPSIPPYPTTLDELTILELGAATALLRLACGGSKVPLNSKNRALLCLLASVLNFELYLRKHPPHH
jgi:hypothetical protein